MRRLTNRAQFLKAARGRRANRRGIGLQAVKTNVQEPGIGFTVTKKQGNAAERNRIKRRLRAAVHVCETAFRPEHDYVVIGRREVLHAPFLQLVETLKSLIETVHSNRPRPRRT